MHTNKGRLGLLSGVALLAALVGCGGGGGHASSNTARLRMTMAWPAPSRMVPNATNSVVAIVTVKGKEVARSTFVRPGASRQPIYEDGGSTILELERLPAGTATVTLAAYPGYDGAGVVQATGSATEILHKGETTEEVATMASTVATLSITPSPLTVAKDATASLTVEARDAANRVVLLETRYREVLTWSSSVEAAATVDDEGVVTGVAAGTADVTVSMVVDDAGNKKTATSPVTVTAPVRTLVSVDCSHTGTLAAPYILEFPREQFDLIGNYSDGTQELLTSEGTLTMDDPSVVSYSGGNLNRGTIGQTTQGHWSVDGFTGSFYIQTSAG